MKLLKPRFMNLILKSFYDLRIYCMCPTYLQDIMQKKTLNSHYIIYISLYGTVNCAVKLKFKGYIRKWESPIHCSLVFHVLLPRKAEQIQISKWGKPQNCFVSEVCFPPSLSAYSIINRWFSFVFTQCLLWVEKMTALSPALPQTAGRDLSHQQGWVSDSQWLSDVWGCELHHCSVFTLSVFVFLWLLPFLCCLNIVLTFWFKGSHYAQLCA